ncbi:hypothetical protein VTI74DRAFT_1540 [Chaetomium olivicolor]
MRVTGPTIRRRNHAWLQMRSLRRAERLARRQEQEDAFSDDADTSGDESASSVDSSDDESDTEATKTTRPPIVSATAGIRTGRGVILLPTVSAPRATIPPGGTLAVGEADAESESDGVESDGEESADESTTVPATATPPPAAAPPPPAAITSAAPRSTTRASPPPAASTGSPSHAAPPTVASSATRVPPQAILPTSVPSASRSSSLDKLVTSLTRAEPTRATMLPLKPVTSATTAASPTVPQTGGVQSEEPQLAPEENQGNQPQQDRLGVTSASRNTLSSGAIAGIVIGVLAFVALLAGAALFWRKRRRARGLPFFPQKRWRLGDSDDGKSHTPAIGGPLPGKVGAPAPVKTNTQIMDDLMKAAYAVDGGESISDVLAPAPTVPRLPPQLPPPQQQNVFIDEKAYAALAGPPTPGEPKKPVMKWLNEVKTPTQPNGPEIPPTPEMPSSATMPRLPNESRGGGRVPEPPGPAYFGRDTMTTDTTNTSVRWYG